MKAYRIQYTHAFGPKHTSGRMEDGVWAENEAAALEAFWRKHTGINRRLISEVEVRHNPDARVTA